MTMPYAYDAVVVGSGPNGLAAAIALARAGCSVLVYEANATIGGGTRSAELTRPGFLHDVCSAVHPLAAGSPFFKALPLERFGLEWIQPEIPLAHSLLPLESIASSAFGLVLGMAGHAVGWPIPRGGSQAIANALANYLRELGGKIEINHRAENLNDLPKSRAVLLDVSVWEFLRIAREQLPTAYRRRLESFRHGPGIFKIDYALSKPIPWKAEACRRAGTIHLGGTRDEMAAAERDVARGRIPERPFTLVAQQSLFDETRAPRGQHTLWAYCHVPFDCDTDMSGRIESQIERFAPGFRDCILARHKMGAADLEKSNPNLAGGDINGGAANLMQLIARPILSPAPYGTPLRGVYLCSSSTPPGGGVHGMCGYYAARLALREIFGKRWKAV